MEENRQLVGNICASIEELGNVIVDNVAASHKDYEIMIASLDNSIAEIKKEYEKKQEEERANKNTCQ
mgnify:CR=1 FL=1